MHRLVAANPNYAEFRRVLDKAIGDYEPHSVPEMNNYIRKAFMSKMTNQDHHNAADAVEKMLEKFNLRPPQCASIFIRGNQKVTGRLWYIEFVVDSKDNFYHYYIPDNFDWESVKWEQYGVMYQRRDDAFIEEEEKKEKEKEKTRILTEDTQNIYLVRVSKILAKYYEEKHPWPSCFHHKAILSKFVSKELALLVNEYSAGKPPGIAILLGDIKTNSIKVCIDNQNNLYTSDVRPDFPWATAHVHNSWKGIEPDMLERVLNNEMFTI